MKSIDSTDRETAHNQKAAFSTKQDADGAASLAHSRYVVGGRLVSYQCSICDLWHLSTKQESA